MTITQFITIILVLVFLYVSYIQWRNQRKWKKVLKELSDVSTALAGLVKREAALLEAKEQEVRGMQEIIKELDAEIAFHKCKKEGI